MSQNTCHKRNAKSSKLKNAAVVALKSPIVYVMTLVENAKLNYQLQSAADKPYIKNHNILLGIVLTSCLCEVPLRVRNWADMCLGYTPESECVFKKDGEWHLSVPKEAFKNHRSKAVPENFQYTFTSYTSELLDIYVEIIKNHFPPSPYLFINARGEKKTASGLGMFFKNFTRTYGDAELSPDGINIHFMRDIVATTYLKINKGSYTYAAHLLLDSEHTVRDHYGHLSSGDSFLDWRGNITSFRDTVTDTLKIEKLKEGRRHA